MAAENGLMRPLRSDSLKPRPSTQAVWEPRRPAEPFEPAPEAAPAEPEAVWEPAVQETPAAAQEPVCEPEPEVSAEEPSLPPYSESGFTFAPACGAQPAPQEPAQPQPEPEAAEEAQEEPFDLDAVIASILAEDDGDEDDDSPSAQDALPTEKMPEPVTVPLYDPPRAKPKHRGWLLLIAAALAAAAAGCAAKRLGWLN